MRAGLVLLILLLVLLTAGPIRAEGDYNDTDDGSSVERSDKKGGNQFFGAGLILGEPTGITAKLHIHNVLALQLSLAFLFFSRDSAVVFVDLVWHPNMIVENKQGALLWYIGIGVGAGISTSSYGDYEADPALWLRMPVGFSYLFKFFPLEAFMEFAPAVRLYSPADFDFFAGAGARWYF